MSYFLEQAADLMEEVDTALKRIGSTSPDRKITIATFYALMSIAQSLEYLAGRDD